MKPFKNGQWPTVAIAVGLVVFLSNPASGEPKGKDKDMTISNGKSVSIEYTLKLKDESVVDTNVGGKPLTYTQGSHQIIPGLEKALEGMKSGENAQVTVNPEEGYGLVDENAFQEISKEKIPPDALKEGTQLQGQDKNGNTFMVRVSEVKEDTVVLDLNHPLAGETLFFDVKILKVQEGEEQK